MQQLLRKFIEERMKGYIRIASYIFKCELIQKAEIQKADKARWDIIVYILFGDKIDEVNIGSFNRYSKAADYFHTILQVLNDKASNERT